MADEFLPRASVSDVGRPRVSVVTPVYNEERYIGQCIESVLGQDYPNWDYTIINNCSTDRTRDIASQYAAQDCRIVVVDTPECVGAPTNHNTAARLVSRESKYCKFVFADDWLFPECLSRMVDVAERYPTVSIVGSYGLQESEVVWDGLPYPSVCVSGRDVCRRRFLDGTYPFGTPTTLLFRSDVVRRRDPFFNESNLPYAADPWARGLHADEDVCLALLKDGDFGFVHQVLSFTRVSNESAHSYSERMNTHQPARISYLFRPGPVYLTPDEQARCLARDLAHYYDYLGAALFKRRDREFWTFHQRSLAALGLRLNVARLWRGAVARGFRLLSRRLQHHT